MYSIQKHFILIINESINSYIKTERVCNSFLLFDHKEFYFYFILSNVYPVFVHVRIKKNNMNKERPDNFPHS